jgi:hypothetical protein
VDERFIAEGVNPFRYMTGLAVLHGEAALDIPGSVGFDMQGSRSVTDLAAGVLQVRGFLGADETARFAVACGMAEVASLEIFGAEALAHPFNALKGFALLGVALETGVLLFVARSAGV